MPGWLLEPHGSRGYSLAAPAGPVLQHTQPHRQSSSLAAPVGSVLQHHAQPQSSLPYAQQLQNASGMVGQSRGRQHSPPSSPPVLRPATPARSYSPAAAPTRSYSPPGSPGFPSTSQVRREYVGATAVVANPVVAAIVAAAAFTHQPRQHASPVLQTQLMRMPPRIGSSSPQRRGVGVPISSTPKMPASTPPVPPGMVFRLGGGWGVAGPSSLTPQISALTPPAPGARTGYGTRLTTPSTVSSASSASPGMASLLALSPSSSLVRSPYSPMSAKIAHGKVSVSEPVTSSPSRSPTSTPSHPAQPFSAIGPRTPPVTGSSPIPNLRLGANQSKASIQINAPPKEVLTRPQTVAVDSADAAAGSMRSPPFPASWEQSGASDLPAAERQVGEKSDTAAHHSSWDSSTRVVVGESAVGQLVCKMPVVPASLSPTTSSSSSRFPARRQPQCQSQPHQQALRQKRKDVRPVQELSPGIALGPGDRKVIVVQTTPPPPLLTALTPPKALSPRSQAFVSSVMPVSALLRQLDAFLAGEEEVAAAKRKQVQQRSQESSDVLLSELS